MEDGVYIVSRNGDIEYTNPALKREFGPVESGKCYRYLHDREETCPWCNNDEVFAGKTVRWELNSPKTGKTYDLIDTPVKNPDGSISKLEIFHDITERKRVEHLKDEFIGLVSHELRTPLGFIKGYSTSLLREDTHWDDKTQREFLPGLQLLYGSDPRIHQKCRTGRPVFHV
jgi:signal transduction histidine kinase